MLRSLREGKKGKERRDYLTNPVTFCEEKTFGTRGGCCNAQQIKTEKRRRSSNLFIFFFLKSFYIFKLPLKIMTLTL